MKTDIYNRQQALVMKRVERDRVKRRLENANTKLQEARITRDRLHKLLTKEQQDVIKLGRFSFMNKISEWTGKWDDKMEKEMSEVVEAEMLYNEAEKNVIDLEAEARRFQSAFDNPDFAFLDEDWADFLKEKTAWLRRYDSKANATLHKIADERLTIRSLLREISEAQDAGENAVRALDKALDKLDSAEGLSIWDTFLGGGMIVSALKYSEMDSSDDYVHRAQRALRHYKTELMDVQNVASASFTINNNDIFTFTDLFFDNIFSDWMIHSRITEMKTKMNDILKEVYKVQNQLARKHDELNYALEQLEVQERTIIEG